jgi:hypothetical protein
MNIQICVRIGGAGRIRMAGLMLLPPSRLSTKETTLNQQYALIALGVVVAAAIAIFSFLAGFVAGKTFAKWEKVNLSDYEDEREITVLGKGKKWRTIPINDVADGVLKELR